MSDTASPGFWFCAHCRKPNPKAAYVTHCLSCGRTRVETAHTTKPSHTWLEHGRNRASAAAAGIAHAGRALRQRAASARMPRGPLAVLSLGYAVCVFLAWIVMRLGGDLWWPATILLYSPRVLGLVPIVPFALLAAKRGQRTLWWLHSATALGVLGPIMGWNLPLSAAGPSSSRPTWCVMTLNAGGLLEVDATRLTRLLDSEQVDILYLQEASGELPDPLRHYFQRGWLTSGSGGLRVFARADRFDSVAPDQSHPGIPTGMEGDIYAAEATIRSEQMTLSMIVVHLPTIRWWINSLLTLSYTTMASEQRLRQEHTTLLKNYLTSRPDRPTLVMGDFNMPADSRLWDGFDPRYQRAFQQSGFGYGFTMPVRAPWCGIDHIFGSRQLHFQACWVGPDVGSDHLPLLARFEIVP